MLAMLAKRVDIRPPSVVAAVATTRTIPTAITPYSIAATPLRSVTDASARSKIMWTSLPNVAGGRAIAARLRSSLRGCCHARTDCFNRRTIQDQRTDGILWIHPCSIVTNRHLFEMVLGTGTSLHSPHRWAVSAYAPPRLGWRLTVRVDAASPVHGGRLIAPQSYLTWQGGKIVSLNVKSGTYH